jgi:hypothetical protein
MTKKLIQEFQIKDYPEINFMAGTMDKSTYKGCFLEVKGHFKSKTENHNLMMRKVVKQINSTIYCSLDKELFREQFITTSSISDSFAGTGSSFTTLEFTFFPKKKTNKDELTNKLNEMCDEVYKQNIIDNRHMEFYKSIQKKQNG